MEFFEKALNMCGYNSPNDFTVNDEWKDYKRIYIGHEYCSTFLISFEKQLEEILSVLNDEIRITIVFPVIQEIHWCSMERICAIIEIDLRIDEIIVNDFGTMNYCATRCGTKHLVLGKLFNKSSREARVDLWQYSDISKKELLCESIFDTNSFKSLMKKYDINRIETELISEKYVNGLLHNNSGYKVDIHYPFVYITSGTICPLNCNCSHEGVQFEHKESCLGTCKDTLITISNPVFDIEVINRGNTYMYRTNYVIETDTSTINLNNKYRLVINKNYGERK